LQALHNVDLVDPSQLTWWLRARTLRREVPFGRSLGGMGITVEQINERIRGKLAGEMGIELLELSPTAVTSRLVLRETLMNTMGSLHAAATVAIADTTCGAGCLASLPAGATGFVTLELKANFVGGTRQGAVRCTARVRHSGARTQVWEATIEDEETGKAIAFFSCTQLILGAGSADP